MEDGDFDLLTGTPAAGTMILSTKMTTPDLSRQPAAGGSAEPVSSLIASAYSSLTVEIRPSPDHDASHAIQWHLSASDLRMQIVKRIRSIRQEKTLR